MDSSAQCEARTAIKHYGSFSMYLIVWECVARCPRSDEAALIRPHLFGLVHESRLGQNVEDETGRLLCSMCIARLNFFPYKKKTSLVVRSNPNDQRVSEGSPSLHIRRCEF